MKNQAKTNEVIKDIEAEAIKEIPIKYHEIPKPPKVKRHNWKQMGNVIFCDSCDNEHGFYVNVEDKLVGIDKDGMPILDKKF